MLKHFDFAITKIGESGIFCLSLGLIRADERIRNKVQFSLDFYELTGNIYKRFQTN